MVISPKSDTTIKKWNFFCQKEEIDNHSFILMDLRMYWPYIHSLKPTAKGNVLKMDNIFKRAHNLLQKTNKHLKHFAAAVQESPAMLCIAQTTSKSNIPQFFMYILCGWALDESST